MTNIYKKNEKSFDYLVACFYQGSVEEHKVVGDWISSTLNFLSNDQKKEVGLFLTDLLRPEVSDKEIEQVWLDAGPVYYIKDGGLRVFLGMVMDAISKS